MQDDISPGLLREMKRQEAFQIGFHYGRAFRPYMLHILVSIMAGMFGALAIRALEI